jgi:hypothetical protein
MLNCWFLLRADTIVLYPKGRQNCLHDSADLRADAALTYGTEQADDSSEGVARHADGNGAG